MRDEWAFEQVTACYKPIFRSLLQIDLLETMFYSSELISKNPDLK
jgi:hypothetical protein